MTVVIRRIETNKVYISTPAVFKMCLAIWAAVELDFFSPFGDRNSIGVGKVQ